MNSNQIKSNIMIYCLLHRESIVVSFYDFHNFKNIEMINQRLIMHLMNQIHL